MKGKWPQRAYIGLYAGAGRAEVDPTGEIIETTAMSVLRLPEPFTHYIFVENDRLCAEALQGRIGTLEEPPAYSIIQKDVEDAIPDIKAALPTYSKENRLLSLCFVDPFSADLDFGIIKELGQGFYIDFLILLMSAVDIRQNFQRYLDERSDTRIAKLLDDPGWRDDWYSSPRRNEDLVPFLLEKFDAAMVRLGYPATTADERKPVRVHGRGVLLYHLLFYSRDPLGKKLFQAARGVTDPQRSLGI